MKRKGRKSAAQTPAPPKERVYGSKKNPVGSAASKTSASSIVLSTSALKTLKDKKDKFNKENPSKKVGLPALKAVMRRGMGAYSKSHRPTITGGVPNSRQAWGFARVNKFLKKKSGEKVKAAYVQDDDLLEKGGEIKLLAPNGKKSNLTPEQYKLVRTPEFKAWFGDWENDPKNASKVVDENGEPKVMYHGTLFDFNEFIPEDDFGFLIDRNIYFFTDDVNVAKGFASIKKRGKNKDKKVRIINAYINSRKPFDPEANKNEFDILYKITKYKNLADWMPNNWELLEDKKNVKKIKQLGYDSIITTETDSSVVFGKLSSSYKGKSLKNLGVFKSSQVKLADGTNTTFDPNNPDIRYEDGGFLQSIYEGMDNLIKNGIVLTDKSKSVSVIAYNTGNQERDNSLYNKALIYYSVKPLRQANEIIENFDNEEYSLFDVKKIEEYKNAPHLIILNQNEVVYDSNNPNIRYKEGGNTKQIFIHWTDRGGLKNILSENILFEETSLTDSLKLPFDIDNNLPFGIVFKDNIYKELYKIDEEQAGTLLEIEHEYRTKNKIIFDIYFDGFVVRNQKNRKSLESYLENSQYFWQNDNLRKYYKEKGYNIRKAESPNKYHLGGDMSKHLAPNGNPSNLTHEQWHLVRTPEFKAWFGDWENDPENASKVVDENGEPLVMWHKSTSIEPFFEFDKKYINKNDPDFWSNGFWFSRDIGNTAAWTKLGGEGFINSYFLNIRNILENDKINEYENIYEDEIENNDGTKNRLKLIERGYDGVEFEKIINPIPILNQMFNRNEKIYIDRNSHLRLGKSGVDLVYHYIENGQNVDDIYLDTWDGKKLDKQTLDYQLSKIEDLITEGVVITFEPNQIKLADGTNTTFDPNNPDIRYKRGGEMKHEIALPDTYASYDRLKDILENQGYELQKKGNELPVGKLAKGMTLSEVAAIHGLKADDLKSELKLGIETEKEHTDIAEYARAIALDHLYEDPKYYTKLKKMEKSYKDGGEIAHISGKAGGVLVGRRHSEGGIKAVNKSNNQPLEMEGGEVVITRNAVSDSTKREFEGEMLTNREILSRINQSGGGVAFADGGEVEPKCACKGNKYKWGGKMVSDYDIVNQINNLYEIPKKVVEKPFDMTGVRYADMKPSEALKKLFGYSSYAKGGMANEKGDSVFLGSKYLPSMKGFVKMMKAVQSPFEGDNATYIPKRVHYDVRFFRDGGINAEEITKAEAYKTFLFDEYGIKFKDLPAKIQNALMIGNQQLIDNYINQ